MGNSKAAVAAYFTLLPMYVLVAGAAHAAAPASTSHGNCGGLAGLSVPAASATVLGANSVAAGAFTPPSGPKVEGLPAFCRVTAKLKPSPASDINVEIWLPAATQWNGKYLGTGNGNLGGTIAYHALADGLKRGYAVANTDLGTSSGAESMIGVHDKIVDFGHRSTHLMTVLTKQVVGNFYAKPPSRSYFMGCSTGGGQGLHEALRYPTDYDGILAGAPGSARVTAHLAYLWAFMATQHSPDSFVPRKKLELWGDKVMASCDAQDGLKDGVIGRPDKCQADPAVMQCKSKDAPDCLTAAQVETLRKIYSGPKHAVTGEQIAPGYPRGTERGFYSVEPTNTPVEAPAAWPFQWVWGKKFNWRGFNWGADVDAMHTSLDEAVDATSTDLRAFQARGGKLIIYQGLVDPVQVAGLAREYVTKVQAAMPTEAAGFVKYFEAPGMAHCFAGEGPNVFGNTNARAEPSQDPNVDLMSALDQWVEKGRTPTQVVATKYAGNKAGGKIERTMPLCAWPKVTKYTGNGDPNDAKNFSCVDAD